MPYRIAGIDVHKKMLAVVCADVEEMRNQYQFERKRFASNPEQLRMLAQWLIEQEVVEVVIGVRRRSIGNQYGERWNDIGSPSVKPRQGQDRRREHCTWHKPNPIVGREGGREIFPMPNVW